MKRTIPFVLLGGLIAGALDISYAIVFSWFRSGAQPLRILQSVASGLLGRDSYQGGIGTGLLGLALHFTIALTWAGLYFLASRKARVLVSQAVVSGIVYGAFIFAFMNLAVLPLSRIRRVPSMTPPVLVTGLLVHMFCIGLPIALASRRADAASQRAA